MSDNDDNRLLASGSDSDEPGADHPPKSTRRGAHDERGYTGFDEQDDDYEEPDRDTDCATIYSEDDEEEYYLDDPEPVAEDIFSERRRAGDDPGPEPDDDWAEDEDDEWDRDERWDDDPQRTSDEWDDGNDEESDPPPGSRSPVVGLPPRREMMDSDLGWDEEDAYPEEAVEESGMWPLSLIAVAVVAILLLAAGGYGVLQQRAAMQEEIRQLQADLATAVTPAEAAASREAARDLEQRNGELQARLDALTLENRRLEETVSGLEARLEERPVEVAESAAAATPPAPEKPAPAAEPAPVRTAPPEKPAAPGNATEAGGWFVNFGSYSQKAMAESWAARLQPPAGRVVVTSGSKGGELFYRVRVIDLSSREQAERTARKLEGDYGLSRLWVGSQ